MKLSSKQLGVWAINSRAKLKSNIFVQARLKLTFLYVLLLAIILTVFSIFLYSNLTKNIVDISSENFSSAESMHHYIHSESEDIRDVIVSSDIFILLIASFLSFWLAGKTLQPINKSLDRVMRFSADASHELRTPLAAIKIQNEVLLRNNARSMESVEKVLRNNIEEVDRMTAITENLLLLARADVNASSIEEIDLGSLLQKIKGMMNDLALHKGLTLNTSIISHSSIKGNREFLERAITNIVQNSIDHTEMGGAITVSLNEEKKYAHIVIKDTGEGIDPKHLPHLFERFYKVDSSRGIKKGNGLGLSIVYEIIRQHRGMIRVESEIEKGTSVFVELPTVEK